MNRPRKIFILVVLLLFVLAACNSDDIVPPGYDWCYRFDLVNNNPFNAAVGQWVQGVGYLSTPPDGLSLSYENGVFVEPMVVIVDIARVDIGDISIDAAGSVFGVFFEIAETLPAAIETTSIPLYPAFAGDAGTNANVTMESSGTVAIQGVSVYGRGVNPFGASNCGGFEGTATAIFPTGTATATVIVDPSTTPTVTETQIVETLTNTPEPNCQIINSVHPTYTNFSLASPVQVLTNPNRIENNYNLGLNYTIPGGKYIYAFRINASISGSMTDAFIVFINGTSYVVDNVNPGHWVYVGQSTDTILIEQYAWDVTNSNFTSLTHLAQLDIAACDSPDDTGFPTIVLQQPATWNESARYLSSNAETKTDIVGPHTIWTPGNAFEPVADTLVFTLPRPVRATNVTYYLFGSSAMPNSITISFDAPGGQTVPGFSGATGYNFPSPTWIQEITLVNNQYPEKVGLFITQLVVNYELSTTSAVPPTPTPTATATPTTIPTQAPPTPTPLIPTVVTATIRPTFTSLPTSAPTQNPTRTPLPVYVPPTPGPATNTPIVNPSLTPDPSITATVTGTPFGTGTPAATGTPDPEGQALGTTGNNIIAGITNLFSWAQTQLTIFGNTFGGLGLAWSSAPVTAIPGLPTCQTNPLSSELCAIYYILRHTILNGPIGGLIVPAATILVDLHIIAHFLRFARAIIARIAKIVQ